MTARGMWDHGLFDPAIGAGPDARSIERRLRRVLVHYPCFWRQLYGEDLITTSMATLARVPRNSPRLPARMLIGLWAGAARERFAAFIASFKIHRWFFTGHGLRGDDRWRARDVFMGANRRARPAWSQR